MIYSFYLHNFFTIDEIAINNLLRKTVKIAKKPIFFAKFASSNYLLLRDLDDFKTKNASLPGSYEALSCTLSISLSILSVLLNSRDLQPTYLDSQDKSV